MKDYEKNTATNDTARKFNWKRKSSGTAKIMTYGKILSLEDGTECFVIVSSVITPINNTIEIIKDQIFVISIVFFVLAVAISLYASQKNCQTHFTYNQGGKGTRKEKLRCRV